MQVEVAAKNLQPPATSVHQERANIFLDAVANSAAAGDPAADNVLYELIATNDGVGICKSPSRVSFAGETS